MLNDINPSIVLIILAAVGLSSFIAFTVYPAVKVPQLMPLQLPAVGDKDREKTCSILQLQLKNVDKVSMQAESNSPDEKLKINALYYWKILDCPKVLSDMIPPVDNNKIMEISRKNMAPIQTDFSSTVATLNQVQTESSGKDKSDESLIDRCQSMKTKYHVVPRVSWGSLSTDLQMEWTTLECDKLSNDVPHDNKTPDVKISSEEFDKLRNDLADEASLRAKIKADKGKKVKSLTAGLPRVSQENANWCLEARTKYQVVPMKSWGKLTESMIELWKSRRCDLAFTAIRLSMIPLATCLGPNGTESSISKFTNKYHSSLPLIAVMAASTTRKVPDPSPDSIALFVRMLPSLIRTIDCRFRYMYVLGFDVGDPFYDSEEGMLKVKKWFKRNVEIPLKANGIMITLRVVKVNNTLKKPGPVFNEMARQAYNDGADYFYRINDDTEIIHHWPTLFVNTLTHLKPPYGVVGPRCNQGNTNILTHDFVHRTHMEIFEMNYYPPKLTDWWMDDWISYVYGRHRTFKANKATVTHHTGAHGQRYEVDSTNYNHLKRLLNEGRSLIRKWMMKHGATSKDIKIFDADVFHVFVHNDIPESVATI